MLPFLTYTSQKRRLFSLRDKKIPIGDRAMINSKRQLLKVMIVDDEILAIEHLKSLLNWEEYGFTVTVEALTAIQAIELAKEVQPEVIFMDIRMPHMDGLEISKRILSHNKRVKIVLFTSHRDFEYAQEAIKIGISNYLIKHEMNAVQLKEELAKIKNELNLMEQQGVSLIRQSLRELLEGSKPSTPALQELEQRNEVAQKSFILLFVQAETPFPVVDTYSPNFHKGMPDGEIRRSQAISEALDYVDTIVLEKGKQAMLFTVKQTNNKNLMWSLVYDAAFKIQAEARRNVLTVEFMEGGCERSDHVCQFGRRQPGQPHHRGHDKKTGIFTKV